MNEQQIELWVEKAMDRLDKALMRGAYTQSEYDRESQFVADWAKQQYAEIQKTI